MTYYNRKGVVVELVAAAVVAVVAVVVVVVVVEVATPEVAMVDNHHL